MHAQPFVGETCRYPIGKADYERLLLALGGHQVELTCLLSAGGGDIERPESGSGLEELKS